MTRKELVKRYLEFFKSKDHKEIPNASLIPRDNSTSLFIGSGMETIIPYLLGQKHPLGKKLVNVQKCVRTIDIDEVGDTYHHSFFEMLGNWSLGDYWKKEAIEMTYEFVTEHLNISKERLAATCFKGNKNAPKDTESENVYLELGFPKERIAFLKEDSNFWGPVGSTGPCGPNTEIFYWTPNNTSVPKKFDSGNTKWLEIGNNVLMTYNKNNKGEFVALNQKNIDFGGGVERTLASLNGLEDNYLAEMWKPIIEEIEKLSGKTYKDNERIMRIIADHIKASVFIISDGVSPSNTGRGYVLRRLIRRAIRYGREINIEKFSSKVAEPVFKIYDDYKELKQHKKYILGTLEQEEERFNQTLETGLKQFNKLTKSKKEISGKDAFLLYQSYGFPIEIINDLAKEKGIKVDTKEFERQLEQHQELSRTASAGTFKSGLADNSEQVKKLHTATHLLNEALRKILGKEVRQKGSNITSERLRFDFNFPRKLTDEEVKKVENLVNEKIRENLKVTREEMPLKKALSSGAQSEFGTKYPEVVSVYSIGDFSKEVCTGPHVSNTKEIGQFRIKKEESSSAGVRRIKAVVE
ncbi:alanine--tRNA ligase [Candidatus Pacearchaeota archaeon CG10_big_fil_rev_8_21_14_0_10_34_12]|nr:MAG: alanine--tRNA ligase [Candidatus Pacearchaeota archaeon CG10_big_fil_rev_8_21_14_0_10_34_12]